MEVESTTGLEVIPLRHGWPGWWSMIEMFRVHGPAVYMDLDTTIVGDISFLADEVMCLADTDFLLLRQWSSKRLDTGVTAWGGNFEWLTDQFAGIASKSKFTSGRKRGSRMVSWGAISMGKGHFTTDAEYVQWALRKRRDVNVSSFQNRLGNEYIESYKLTLNHGKYKPRGPIVCFHGHPRPWHKGVKLNGDS
jgi:hypothetical protein